jgi:hypothetical protein
MSAYVVLGTGRPSRAADAILSLLRMQAPSFSGRDSPGLCATCTLTADDKVGLEAGLQLGVGLVMVVLVLASWWVRGCQWWSVPTARHTVPGGGDLSVGLLSSPCIYDGGPGDWAPRVHSLNVVNSAPAATGAVSPVSDGTRLPPRARYITAAVNFGVTAYSTVTVATVKMLHCVWVPGTPLHQRRLFIRGSVVCDYSGWQAPHVVVLAVLVVAPFALPFAAAWSRRPGSQQGRAMPPVSLA